MDIFIYLIKTPGPGHYILKKFCGLCGLCDLSSQSCQPGPGLPACCQQGLSACLPARPTSLSAPLARLSFLPAPGMPSGPTSLPHGPASLPLGCQPSGLPPASVTWAPGPPTWTFSPGKPVTRRRKYMGVGSLMVGRGSQTCHKSQLHPTLPQKP